MRTLAILTLAALAACTSTRLTAGTPTPTAPTPIAAASAGVEVIGGDEAALREFLQRWFFAGLTGELNQESTIWIGQLPEKPPLPIPLPDRTRVVGSIEGPYIALELILDVDQPSGDVRQFYRQALEDDGWTVPQAAAGGGFNDLPYEVDGYCLKEAGAYLTLTARDVVDQPSDVRLSLMMPAESTPCDAEAAGQPPDAFALIPALSTPPGVAMRDGSAGSGSGSGGEYAEASANLLTSLSPADLMSHYADQLVAAGWESLSSSSTDTYAMSTWLLSDTHEKEWDGMVLIIATPFSPDKDERYALVRVTEKR